MYLVKLKQHCYDLTFSGEILQALFPGLALFDCLQYAKMEGEALVNESLGVRLGVQCVH